jgi:hypothetical protein
MTAMERERGGGGALIVIAVLGMLFLVMAASTLPEDVMTAPVGDVQLGSHAAERHGSDAEAVRAHFAQQATRDEFWQRPPCKDGRHRFVDRMEDGRWAVWVLQQVGPMEWQEVTAFVTQDQGYVKDVLDRCGHGSWLGHAYGG